MTFFELTPEQLPAHLTMRPEQLLEPVLDELLSYREATQTLRGSWAEFKPQSGPEGLTLAGLPLHPYLLWRLASSRLGISRRRGELWAEQPDLLAAALARSAQPGDDALELISTRGVVVALNNTGLDLGHHLDFLEPALARFVRSQRRSQTAFALAGYQLDPLWVHLRLLYLPLHTERRFAVGYALDANHLFSTRLRGRASVAPFAQDLPSGATLNLDTWWSVRTPRLNAQARDLRGVFERNLRGLESFRSKATDTLQALVKRDRKPAQTPWRQALLAEAYRHGLPKAAARSALAQHVTARTTPLQYAFSLALALRGATLDRRLAVERELARALKGGHA